MSADFDKSERNAKISYIHAHEKENTTIHFVYTSDVYIDPEDTERSMLVENRIYATVVHFMRIYIDGYPMYIPYRTVPVPNDSFLSTYSIVNFIKTKNIVRESVVVIDDLYDIANFLTYMNGKDNLKDARSDMLYLVGFIKSIGFKRCYFFVSNNFGNLEKEITGQIDTIKSW